MQLDNVTISGGFAYTVGPPTQATAGWYGMENNLQRQMFANDTATASYRGSLPITVSRSAGTFTLDYGWIAGGTAGTDSAVQRITFANDTATASIRGSLTLPVVAQAGTGNSTAGWYAGGSIGAPTYAKTSTVQRITYATDTANSSIRGPLTSVRYTGAAAGTSTDGWFMGGYNPSGGTLATVDRITYANDNSTASARANMAIPQRDLAACSDGTTYAWAAGGGGVGSPPYLSLVQRIIFATDTAAATTRGPLSEARFRLSSTQNTTDGWFAGGALNGFDRSSRIDRITFATDTNTASVRGPLFAASYAGVGLSGVA